MSEGEFKNMNEEGACKKCGVEGETDRTAKAVICIVCGRMIGVDGHGPAKIIDGVCMQCLEEWKKNPDEFVKKHRKGKMK